MSASITEPLRAERRELLPHLAELDQTASTVSSWSAQDAGERLARILEFLQDHLVPHAVVEEQVLYPAVEDAMGAPGATATMVADHREIVARIERLGETAGQVAGRWPQVELVDDVTNQLAALSAIIGLHFAKEEDVLLPILDDKLTPESAEKLFERMEHPGIGGGRR